MTASRSPHKYFLLDLFNYELLVIPARHSWIRDMGLGFLTKKRILVFAEVFQHEDNRYPALTLRNGWFLDEHHFFLYAVFSQLPSRQKNLDSGSGTFCCKERSGLLETHDIGHQHVKGKTLIFGLKMCYQKLLSQQQTTLFCQMLNLSNTIFVLIPFVSVQDKSY